MKRPSSSTRHFLLAGLLGWLTALPASAQPPAAPGPVPQRGAPGGTPMSSAAHEPTPAPWMLAVAIVCGALGVVAVEVAADRRHLVPVVQSRRTVVAHALGRALVGAVFGLFVVSLIPPQGSWLRLVAASLAGGVVGACILLSMLASRQVLAAERERDAAREQAAMAGTLAIESIETFRVMVLAARPCASPAPGEPGGFEHLVNSYADRAKAELAAAVG
jgi:MFS family permease